MLLYDQLCTDGCYSNHINFCAVVMHKYHLCTSKYSLDSSSSQCKKLDIRYGIFLRIFENTQTIRLSTIFEI